VWNKARLEGSMAKWYALKEVLGFCTEYIQDFTATRKRVWDNKEEPQMNDKMFEGNGQPQIMIAYLRGMAHSFVSQNVELMSPWCK
jgi:hypothetical protein